MKKSTLLAMGFLALTSVVFASEIKNEKSAFEIDKKASKVYWTGKKVTGEHTGYLNIEKGTVSVEKNQVSSAVVTMNMNTIVSTDLEGEWADKLIGHLKSDDFFSVEKHPESQFKITSVKKLNGENFQVEGDLTIKGITNKISFPAAIKVANGQMTANGEVVVDRTKWNVQYGSGKFFAGLGDKMIYDEFEIKFSLVANEAKSEVTAK